MKNPVAHHGTIYQATGKPAAKGLTLLCVYGLFLFYLAFFHNIDDNLLQGGGIFKFKDTYSLYSPTL